MEVIGVLGGMGSYATLHIFKSILDKYPAEKEWDRPRVIIDNNCIMPSRVRAILYGEKKEELIAQMSQSIQGLVNMGGVTRIIIGCVTAHHFLPYLPHQDKIINILQETAKWAIEERKIKGDIFALCTEGSRDVGIWSEVFQDRNIIYPDEEKMIKLREFIEHVKQNTISAEVYEKFEEYVQSIPCENILLGCTELPILSKSRIDNKVMINPIDCIMNVI